MAKDYKQRPARKKTPARASRKTAKAPSRWPAFLVGVAVGAVLTVFTLRYEPVETLQQAVKGTTSSDADGDEPTRFEFYTVLPEKEIAIPDTELDDPDPLPEKPPAPSETRTVAAAPETAPAATAPRQPASDERFLLQVSSSRSLADADRLKARLAFLGLESSIQTITLRGETWHRVHVGPVRGRAELAEARGRLRENSFDALVLKLK